MPPITCMRLVARRRSRPGCRTPWRSRSPPPTEGRGRRWPPRGRAAAAPASSFIFMSANFHCRPWNSHSSRPNCLRCIAHCARRLVGVAAERERARGVADALDVEAGDLLLEAAFLQQHVLRRHVDIVEVESAPIPRRDMNVERLPVRDAGRVPRRSAPSRCRRRRGRSARRRGSRRRTARAW